MDPSISTRGGRALMVLAILGMLFLQMSLLDLGPTDVAKADTNEKFEYVRQCDHLINGLSIDPSGKALLVGQSGLIQSYDPSTDEILDIQAYGSVLEQYEAVDHSPDGEEAVIVGSSGAVITVDSDNLKHPKVSTITDQNLNDVDWRPDGAYATIVGNTGTLLRYLPETEAPELLDETNVSGYDALVSGAGHLMGVSWRPDGAYALLVTSTGTVLKFTGDNVTDVSGTLPDQDWMDVAWSTDGSWALVVASGSSIYRFDAISEDWTGFTPPVGTNIFDVAWKDSTTAYVLAGTSNNVKQIFKYDGSATLEDVSPFGSNIPTLNDLGFSSDGSIGLAAGAGVMRFPNQAPSPVTVHLEEVEKTSIMIGHDGSPDLDFHKYEYYISLDNDFTPGPATFAGEETDAGSTTYSFTALVEATWYHIFVRVCDQGGLCTDSTKFDATTLNVTDPPPVTLTLTTTDYTEASLSWTSYSASDFGRYEIHYSTTSGFVPDPLTMYASVSYVHTLTEDVIDLIAGTTYYFKVRVYNDLEFSSDSNEVSGTTLTMEPPNPVEVRVVEDFEEEARYVRLEYTVSDSSHFSRYQIHYSTTDGFTPDGSTFIGEDTYQGYGSGYDKAYHVQYHYLTQENIPYYFKVRVVDTYGLTADSNQVSTVYDGPPADVHNLKVERCDASSCVITWEHPTVDKPADFSHYTIYKTVGGKETKVGKVESWKTTSYTVTGLKQQTSHTFKVVVTDEAGHKSTGARSPLTTTDEDPIAEFLEVLEDPECLCGGGFFFIIFFTSILGGLGKKFGAKGVLWGVPLLACIVTIVGTTALNTLFEMDLPTWFFKTLAILCIILSIVVGIVSAVAKKVSDWRWERQEAERARLRRIEDFNNKRNEVRDKLTRLEQRLVHLRGKAPVALMNHARNRLNAGNGSYSQVYTVADEYHLTSADNYAKEGEQTIVDIEAYIVAKQQATGQLNELRGRVDLLVERSAPRIKTALNLWETSRGKLEEATTLDAVRGAVDSMKTVNGAIEESETSLKDATTQLTELKGQKVFIDSRINEIQQTAADNERTALDRLMVISTQIVGIIDKMARAPDLELLADGRGKVRDAKKIVSEVDERERKRHILLSDLESLTAKKDEVANWTTASLKDVEKRIVLAEKAIRKDNIGKARNHLDEGFGLLEDVEQMNKPKLVFAQVDYEMQVDRWEKLVIHLKNEGTTIAQDIDIQVKSPDIRLLEVGEEGRSTYRIKPGEDTKVPMSVQFTAEGLVPVKVILNYSDYLGRGYTEKRPLKVNVVHRKKDTGEDEEEADGKKGLAAYGIKVIRRSEISQGFFKFKVSIRNKGRVAARAVNFRLIFNKKIFRIHHVYPKSYKLIGDSVDYGDIDPGITTSVEFYLETHMCTETALDGVVTFKDINGQIQTMSVGHHKETFVCPVFIDADTIAPAQVKELIQDQGWRQDTRTYAVPSTLDLISTFDTLKEAIETYDPNLKNVFDDRGEHPYWQEAWYYGETKGIKKGMGIKHVITGRVERVETAGTVKITVASTHKGQMLALSTRLGTSVQTTISKKANLSRPITQIYQTMEIRDSVITGSEIKMGGATDVTGVPGTAVGKTTIKDSALVRTKVSTGAGDTEIESSVLQRTEVGAPSAPPPTPALGLAETEMSRKFDHDTYKMVLRQVWDDGIIEPHEKAQLKFLRAKLNISYEEHEHLEEEILEEMKDHIAEAQKKALGK